MDTHFINKVVLDFSFPDGEKNNALSKTKTLFYEKALSLFNYSFDKLRSHVHIDRLEIDLGQTTEENFEQDLMNAIMNSLAPYSQAVNLSGPGSSKMQSGSELNEISQLMHFLEKGYWPWVNQQKTEEQLNIFFCDLVEKKELALALFVQLRDKKYFYSERLIQLASASHKSMLSLLRCLNDYHPRLSILTTLFESGWEKRVQNFSSIYFFITRQLIVSSPLETVEQLHKFLFDLITLHTETETTIVGNKVVNKHLKMINNWIDAIDKKNSASKQLRRSSTKAVLDPVTLINEKKLKQSDHSDVINSPHPQFSPGQSLEEEEKVLINNAGLILFHPYLKIVFNELDWLDATQQFRSEEKRQRAILFLQYLITGRSKHAEYELLLNKIICNHPINLPLITRCNFSKVEKDAAQDMIESLMEHWQVMKTTSAKGLIESFIRRPGLIQKTENGYLLQIEKKSIDMLLDSLPFSFNIVKLPWNEKIIHTEW